MNNLKNGPGKSSTLTKYVYDYLNRRLLEGSFENGELPTESRLVEELKVSKTTVRLAEARLISEGKIVKIQGKGTFVKDFVSTGVARKCLYLLANHEMRIGRLEFWDSIYDSLIDLLDYDRYAMKLLVLPGESDKQLQFLERERIASDNSAMILLGDFPALSSFLEARKRSMPILRVGACPDSELLATLSTDPEAEMLLALRHLYGLGHRRLAWIGGLGDGLGVQVKMKVLRDFSSRHGMAVDPTLISYNGYLFFEAHFNAAERFMQAPQRPTAIICVNDQVADAVYAGVRRQGLRIPEDVSVIGCDGSSHLKKSPVLTTIDARPREMARRALELIANAKPEDGFWQLLERVSPVLLEGRSTAAPPAIP